MEFQKPSGAKRTGLYPGNPGGESQQDPGFLLTLLSYPWLGPWTLTLDWLHMRQTNSFWAFRFHAVKPEELTGDLEFLKEPWLFGEVLGSKPPFSCQWPCFPVQRPFRPYAIFLITVFLWTSLKLSPANENAKWKGLLTKFKMLKQVALIYSPSCVSRSLFVGWAASWASRNLLQLSFRSCCSAMACFPLPSPRHHLKKGLPFFSNYAEIILGQSIQGNHSVKSRITLCPHASHRD